MLSSAIIELNNTLEKMVKFFFRENYCGIRERERERDTENDSSNPWVYVQCWSSNQMPLMAFRFVLIIFFLLNLSIDFYFVPSNLKQSFPSLRYFFPHLFTFRWMYFWYISETVWLFVLEKEIILTNWFFKADWLFYGLEWGKKKKWSQIRFE